MKFEIGIFIKKLKEKTWFRVKIPLILTNKQSFKSGEKYIIGKLSSENAKLKWLFGTESRTSGNV